MTVHDLCLVREVLLFDKVRIVKVRIDFFLELSRHHEVLVLLQVDSEHPVFRPLLEDVSETGSLVDNILLDFDFLSEAVHILEWVFRFLCANELLKLANIFLLGAEHALSLIAAALVLVSKIDLVLLVHFVDHEVLLFLLLELQFDLGDHSLTVIFLALAASVLSRFVTDATFDASFSVLCQQSFEGPSDIFLQIRRVFGSDRRLIDDLTVGWASLRKVLVLVTCCLRSHFKIAIRSDQSGFFIETIILLIHCLPGASGS